MSTYYVDDGIEGDDDGFSSLEAAIAAAHSWADTGTDWLRDGTEYVYVRDADQQLIETIAVR